jgi:diguanylate cyclase (GGDEF)-like protein/PAS domain S-box-containing protein
MTDSTAGGFTVDFWKAVAAEAGLKYTLRVLPFSQVLQEFKDGKIDVLINLAISDERHQFADFSVPHVIVNGAIFVRKNKTGIKSESDLSGRSVIVLNRDLAHDYAISKGWGKQLVLVETVEEGLQLLASGKHDAMVLSKLVGMQSLQLLGLTNIKPLKTSVGFSQKFAFAVHEGKADLLSHINEAMAITKANGIYTALYDKWFGVYTEKQIILRYLLVYLPPLIALFLVIAIYFYYRRQVERKLAISALQRSEERYDLAMSATQDGIWDWNVLINKVHFSPRWKSMLGYTDNEVKNEFSEWERLIHPDDKDAALLAVEDFLNNKTKKYESEFRMQHKDGRYINILSRAFANEDVAGKIIRLVGTHVDITEHRKAEEKLKLAASVFTHAREGIMITDASGSIVEVNDTFIEITGYSRKELIGQNPRMFHSGRQSHEFYVAMWHEIDTTGHWAGEIWNRRKNGEVFAELKNISAVYDENGVIQNYVAMCSDITLMKEHLSQLERNAHYDLLTNLPNRVFLADRLNQAMMQCSRHKRSLAVAFLDLDGFKVVNDTHGHDVGDELLIALSLRMKEALREGDTLARIGGDEFVAVLADLVKVEDCEPVLERLLLAASEPVTIDEVALNVSASIGITLYPQDSADAEQLMRHADQAMYVAKQSGKNRYHFFDTKQDEAVSIQRESLGNIRSGLERREFVLHYQPKVNMRTGDVIGVEALIRWQHPSLGLLSPADFLPIVEGHTISLDMGKWVIDTALTQISQWKSMGIHIPISVNISAYQLQQGECATCITGLLTAHPEVDPSDLELEILETSALHDVEHVSTVMNTCMALGVKFSLDDFGTGYSSLTHLRRLPVDLIKIDQTFVRDMLVDSDDLAIIEGVIALAKSFKRNVIAEGVETIEHGTVLLQLGCDLAQGYGIARPMPADAIPAWMKDWKPDDAWRSDDIA